MLAMLSEHVTISGSKLYAISDFEANILLG